LMSKEIILSDQQIEDFLTGAEILGTGGGGGRQWALAMLQSLKEMGKSVRIIDPKDLPEDALIVGAAGVGGGVEKEVREKILKKFGAMPSMRDYLKRASLAEKMMVGELGEEISAYLAFELGCGNTILPAVIAALGDKPVVDGDCNGRAVPEVELCTLNVVGIPFTPMVIVTPWMESMVVKRVVDYSRAEDISRYIAVASGGSCLIMGSPIRGKMLPNSIVKNTITKSIKLGEAIRRARDKGKDPVEAAVKALDGYLLFKGRVTEFSREERGGFMWGEHKYEGVDEFAGRRFKIWFKNENLISYLDDKPYVCGPDLLCVVDSKTGGGLSNWGAEFTKGREVSIIGVKADDIWRTERGLKIFNPKHFGFDIEYKPIEEFFK
jgi:DUF917 family protein